MSLTCPKCGTGIEQDFGLFNCPSCGVVLAVDVDGNIQIAESSTEEVFVTNAQDAQEAQAEGLMAEVSGEPIAAEFEEIDFEQFSPQPAPTPVPLPLEQTPQEALEEITKFGNKDSSAGPLTYSVVIDGIDLAPLRSKLQEIFSERQFGWDAKELMRQVRGGRLALEGLSPAQAVMLVRLLRGTNLKISWSQHVYS